MAMLILQTHQAVGSVIHSYTFACVSCGHHPVTVVMDLHKKGVFSMPGKCFCLSEALHIWLAQIMV